ncbi:hypothetical protein AAMO2058_001284200 [Amorphochlora amoebiformis]
MSARLRRILGHISARVSDPQPWEVEVEALDKKGVLELRKKLFSSAQSISYENTEPLMIVGGTGAYLFDEKGERYLDTRNNVNHVGHQNPKVAEAVARQVKKLNSNTRYLHPNVALLADKLLKKFPKELCVVLFVNSGSEANDLALRLAFSYSKSRRVISVERAYHGHTENVINISPYKFYGKGGAGKPEWVSVVPCPDTYRGAHRGGDAGERYVAAFFTESGMSVAGVITPPPNYLKNCYKYVRLAGGLCVADEVQTGFGRFGSFYWGFEQQGVVPDIVTLGKPFGNGMPLAAVVTTRAVSRAFENGMEYFNTFGGNPVCAAAGLAVLSEIEIQGLQARALATGTYLKNRLRKLQESYKIIGHIRGHGLFLGVEFVRDQKSLQPATAEVSLICSRLKNEHKILTTVDGKYDNVLVIKPPMVFGVSEAKIFLKALQSVLETLGEVDPGTVSHTPT